LALEKDAPLHRAVQRSGAIVAIPILARDVADALKGDIPCGLIVLKAGVNQPSPKSRIGPTVCNNRQTLVATVEEIVIGDGRYFADKEGPERAELGFLIAEPYRGRGIATLLLRHLARIAHHAGLSAFEADVLAYNAPMLAVFERSGLPISRRREGNIIHVTLSLRPEQGPEPKRRAR
jgi:ribosomal protein S18 acetylase RimI-like enzyme